MMHTFEVGGDLGIEQIIDGCMEEPLESYIVENHSRRLYIEHYMLPDPNAVHFTSQRDNTSYWNIGNWVLA